MEDEEALLLLRIEALKSSRPQQADTLVTDQHQLKSESENQQQQIEGLLKDNEISDEEETALRQLALQSRQDSKDDEAAEIPEAPIQNIAENDNNSQDKINVEELSLREKALKTLLKKRVVKTETIIKVYSIMYVDTQWAKSPKKQCEGLLFRWFCPQNL